MATTTECVKLAEHYLAIGQTSIWLSDEHAADLPWQYVTDAAAGSRWRLGAPSSVSLTAEHPCGLSFRWSVDLERRDANGSAINQIDKVGLIALAGRIPAAARVKLADMLRNEVLDSVRKRTDELQQALSQQDESFRTICRVIASVDRLGSMAEA